MKKLLYLLLYLCMNNVPLQKQQVYGYNKDNIKKR
jgi:hypothetical protein